MVSIGLLTQRIIALGECARMFSVTDFTMPAFTPMSSSRVIPGLRGMPDVITTMSEPSVAA